MIIVLKESNLQFKNPVIALMDMVVLQLIYGMIWTFKLRKLHFGET
ncbi:hypothetical protein LAV73_06455 [Lysinibacillus xylanilyticus]|nr:hypothetical protein [Lysinibacillus xylanilyticus]MEB2279642.1 hypothetical protein [Lysinibacillus xylanilyticus]